MIRERIADPVILSLIGKWLKAGAMQDGVVVRSEEGTPQGGPISCVLANIYLHYTLDLWFEKKFEPQCRGEAHLVRFVDDFVVSFQYLADAENFQRQLRARLARFNLGIGRRENPAAALWPISPLSDAHGSAGGRKLSSFSASNMSAELIAVDVSP